MAQKTSKNLEEATIRFAGDSGDGMQLTGSQFTQTTAILGNDLSTLPDYPAEIRAPKGSISGVSGFQIHFGSTEVHTPGDSCDVLVAMNAAALKVNLHSLVKGGSIIANTAGFQGKNLELAGYSTNPLTDNSLSSYQIFEIDISKLTALSLQEMQLSSKLVDRTKNFFALGLLYWLYNRPLEPTLKWLGQKFSRTPDIRDANILALKAGWNYGETTELFKTRYEVSPARLSSGTYRTITGNQASAWGLIAAAQKAKIDLFLGSYPITPASDILHELSLRKNFNVKTFQAEDEIAGITSALGAAFAGALGATTTSGPGLSLKSEALGLATMVELPLVIIDVQRAGPSTGLPTKTEQADLLQTFFGRHGEAPLPVLAAATPSDCFHMVFEAARIAITYMTPVICLTDGYLGNGSEPWRIPEMKDLPDISLPPNSIPDYTGPYVRDTRTLSRPWMIPGTAGGEHRIGGLEKNADTGEISYDPENHERMVHLRSEKVTRISDSLPVAKTEGSDQGELLVIGWGSTYGAIKSAVLHARAQGYDVSQLHLRYLHPMQRNIGEILARYKIIFIPELNMGQLSMVIRAKYLRPVYELHKTQGTPFRSDEIEEKIIEILKGASL